MLGLKLNHVSKRGHWSECKRASPITDQYWTINWTNVVQVPWYFEASEPRRFKHVPFNRCHNGSDSVSNHQPHDCLLNRLFRRRSKTTSKLRVTGLCAGNSSGTGEFSAQMASNAENVSIWWRHHAHDVYVLRPSTKFPNDNCLQ